MRINIDKERPLLAHPMGGCDKAGNKYGVNNKYLTKNDQAIIPIMGEFHYSRYNRDEWHDALLKMKAGGVDIVATYIFWIHHEEEKGVFDFSGQRDLRAFVEECGKVGMNVWLRIGPWAHGECRNGGFPDWLCNELGHNGFGPVKGSEVKGHLTRANDPLYLEYVKIFWEKIYEQVSDLMVKDGGPVLGIQLENEYCHAGGAPTKEMGFEHMLTLQKMAADIGFETPYCTATAWGGAIVLEGTTLPVLSGYVDAPWANSTEELPASENFLFIPFHNDANVGSDLASGDGKEFYSKEKNPYLTAELGGGIQVTQHRRTYPFPEDIEAQTLCMLGAGANLLGYYMYHGGTNPDGKLSDLQESKATGYYNDLPRKCYDFCTCIRENGKVAESYHRLKKIHNMIHTFTEELAGADVYLPDVQPESPEDMETPRVSVRYNSDCGTGFLFINNHQRKRNMKAIDGLEVEINVEGKQAFLIHDITVKSSETAIIPFGLKMGDTTLLSTNASLLCKIGDRYFFYADDNAEVYFDFEEEAYEDIVVLTRDQAKYSYIFGNSLYITDKSLMEEDGNVYVLTSEPCEIIRIPEDGEAETIRVQKEAFTDVHEKYLHVDFGGDTATISSKGKLLTDWFSEGEEWVIAMKRYGYTEDYDIEITPFKEGIYYDLPPKKGCQINNKYLEVEYKVRL